MGEFPRITFGIIVLNGEPFVRYNLRSIYPFAYEIIVVEGASIKAAAIASPDGHSVDGTLDTLYRFKEEEDGFSYVRNTIDTMGNGNFVPQNLINSVTINEQISPIAGIDITWKNLLSTKFEFKKTRNLTLNFTNNQIIEVRNNEYVFGVGYRFGIF